MTSEYERELMIAADINMDKVILEAMVYPNNQNGYIRFDELDSQGRMIKYCSFAQEVFTTYFLMIEHGLATQILPLIDTQPGNEYYAVTFKEEMAEQFKQLTRMNLRDLIQEFHMLMPTT